MTKQEALIKAAGNYIEEASVSELQEIALKYNGMGILPDLLPMDSFNGMFVALQPFELASRLLAFDEDDEFFVINKDRKITSISTAEIAKMVKCFKAEFAEAIVGTYHHHTSHLSENLSGALELADFDEDDVKGWLEDGENITDVIQVIHDIDSEYGGLEDFHFRPMADFDEFNAGESYLDIVRKCHAVYDNDEYFLYDTESDKIFSFETDEIIETIYNHSKEIAPKVFDGIHKLGLRIAGIND